MMRRNMLALLVAGVLGCSGSRPHIEIRRGPDVEHPVGAPPPVDLTVVKRKMREAIVGVQPELATEFAGVAVGLLIEFFVGLISQCLLKHVLSQHTAIAKNPEGRLARRWKESVMKQFMAQNPTADQDTVDHYVEGSLVAFRRSTEIELTEIVHSVQNAQVELSDADWERANHTARSLVRAQEEA